MKYRILKIKLWLYPDWYYVCAKCKKIKKRNYKKSKIFLEPYRLFCSSCDDLLTGLT